MRVLVLWIQEAESRVLRPMDRTGHRWSPCSLSPSQPPSPPLGSFFVAVQTFLRFIVLVSFPPPDLLRMFFDCLYDEDVISEDAFYKWESSKDPAEQNGKGVALKSVTAFFTWLREAEEESEDN